MRRLDRASVPAPVCLESYRHGANRWDDLKPEDRAEIWTCLEAMQGDWCAYCEGALASLGRHIEHFRPKGSGKCPWPQGTFEWDNLLGSCDQSDSCGHYKDNGAGAYVLGELINPCDDEPDRYFRFRSDGTISTRGGLSEAEQTRALTTLRVLNLDPEFGRLRQMRKAVLKGFDYALDSESQLSKAELLEYVAEELSVALTLPFQTAIRHVLTEPGT